MKTVIIALALALGANSPVIAQSDDPMESYRAYRQAMESGDNPAALSHAADAYKRAEAAWGAANAKTALLATNYGVELVAAGRSAEAPPLFERCAEILATVPDKATDRAFCLFKAGDAYGRLTEKEEPKAKKAYQAAIDVAEPLADSDLRAAGIAGEAYLGLATKSIPTIAQMRTNWEKNTKDSVFRKTKDNAFNSYAPVKRYASKALPLLEKAYGPSSDLVGIALLYLGYYAEADEDWNEAEKLYTRAYDILTAKFGEDHRLTRQVYGRKAIAGAKTAAGIREFRAAEREDDWEDTCFTATRDDRIFSLCPDGERRKPRYPTSGSFAGQQGYTLVHYDVDENGVTGNIRVVESWPGEVFDNAVINAIKSWKFKPPTDQHGAVSAVKDVELSMTFFIIGN